MKVNLVIAVRGGPGAKSRCAGIVDGATLARAMLCDMVATAVACPQVGKIHVVTPTPAIAMGLPVTIIAEPNAAGMDTAFARACAALPRDAVVVLLPGDLPLLRPDDLAALIGAHRSGAITVVPSATEAGTGAIVLAAGQPMRFAFGPGSFARHMAVLGARRHDCAAIAEDLDCPEHAARALRYGGTHTRACLAGLLQDAT